VAADAEGVVALARGERWLVNPGSVGQSRERGARARAAVLDLDARTVELRRLDYDAPATRRALRAAGLDPSSAHLPPRPLRAATGRVLRRAGLRR
jgi:hypothetical protein